MKRTLVLAMLAVGLVAGTAKAGWTSTGSYNVSGTDTADVNLGRSVSGVRITCTQGSVTIKSIVVTDRDGKEATVDVNERMSKGDSKEVDLSFYLSTRALKINHEGSGTYTVEVK